MSYTVTATINVLPVVGASINIYGQAINDATNALIAADVVSASVLYGHLTINQIGANTYFIPQDIDPIAIKLILTVTGTDRYVFILYTNAIFAQTIPNNFQRLSQKIPLGVFTDISSNTIIGQVIKAKSLMIDDYYDSYFDVQNQVYSNEYSPELEFEYNGTIGLLSNSTYPNDLFHLFSSMAIYGLNAYDLELLISQYIYFRIGVVSAVYIENDPSPIENYWIIEVGGFDQFDQNPPQTVIAPDSFSPISTNIAWTIYNSSSFTDEFKNEVTAFINRMSRADIGSVVTYSPIVDPVDDDFTLVGPTYQSDPRLIFRKCLQYTDKSNYPLNLIGYIKNT